MTDMVFHEFSMTEFEFHDFHDLSGCVGTLPASHGSAPLIMLMSLGYECIPAKFIKMKNGTRYNGSVPGNWDGSPLQYSLLHQHT